MIVLPIYIFERDDLSFRKFDEFSDVYFCEKIDVLESLYEGWDSTGRHLAVVWDELADCPALREGEENLSGFIDSINAYSDACKVAGISFSEKHGKKKNELCDPSELRRCVESIEHLTT